MDQSPPPWQGGQSPPPPQGYPAPGNQGGDYPPAPQGGGYPPAPQGGGYPPAPQGGGYPPAAPDWSQQQQYGGQQYGGQPQYDQYGQQYGGQGQYGGAPQRQLASFWIRVGATLLDGLILAIPVFLISLVVGLIVGVGGSAANANPSGIRFVAQILGGLIQTAIFAGYTIYFISKGQTLGMKVVGTYCVMETTGQPPAVQQSALRWLVPGGAIQLIQFLPFWGFLTFILGPIALLDVLWMLWDPKNQTLHDKVANTLVVKA